MFVPVIQLHLVHIYIARQNRLFYFSFIHLLSGIEKRANITKNVGMSKEEENCMSLMEMRLPISMGQERNPSHLTFLIEQKRSNRFLAFCASKNRFGYVSLKGKMWCISALSLKQKRHFSRRPIYHATFSYHQKTKCLKQTKQLTKCVKGKLQRIAFSKFKCAWTCRLGRVSTRLAGHLGNIKIIPHHPLNSKFDFQKTAAWYKKRKSSKLSC